MSLLDTLTAPPPPLAADDDGVLRVGGTRVRLETVLTAFHAGCAPEEILLKYPSLSLTDIYSIITYYLWHREEVEAYLAGRAADVESSKTEVEQRFPPDGIRAHLLARRKDRE
ncbi:MAG TPA: DUF433 domain-containing protein [Tepidisphaeraceae bacterium]|nr:DUF433 domain-containing protein [Tepidisphaeraceae bacterium]